MVRLRGAISCFFTLILMAFQFQYGAVKRVFTGLKDSFESVFQFQYGAVKREASQRLRELPKTAFNSNMVRLRVFS